MDFKIMFKFARYLVLAILTGYAVAAIAALVTGEYGLVRSFVIKGIILGGMITATTLGD